MRRITTIIVMAGLAAVPFTTAAAAQDLRSPDARDSARATSDPLDLHAPNPVVPNAPAVQQDLRSPDGTDGARGVTTVQPRVVSTPHVIQVPVNDFQWGDAGIGAAAMLGLIALAGGVLLVASGRRHGRRVPRAIG